MNSYKIIAAILFGSLLVALSIIFKPDVPKTSVESTKLATRLTDANQYGADTARIRIVEFSDYECPYCAKLHPTLKKIVDESDGQIVWEYRHLPLQNHPHAYDAAVLSECVAQKDRNIFWTLSDDLLASYQSINNDLLSSLAGKYGLSDEEYLKCQGDSTIAELIETDIAVARSLGARGTPFSVIIYEDGSIKAVPGALPHANWLTLLE